MTDLTVRLGPLELATPLVAASGTVGSVADFVGVGALDSYGAAIAKSVSAVPWPGRPMPRIAPAGLGMLNGIGIQNPGIEQWRDEYGPALSSAPVPVWGSAVGTTPGEYSLVAKGLDAAGVTAVEVNLSCPNLEGGQMFALDPAASASVVGAVRDAVSVPIGAKLSPNSEDIVAVAGAVMSAGADWVTLTNTVWGAGIDVESRRPLLSGVVGGYSGVPMKPIAIRCVWQVHEAFPELPILGCGGVRSGADVVEYLLAGASAVALGTAHFAEPRAGKRVIRQLLSYCKRHGIAEVSSITGGALPW